MTKEEIVKVEDIVNEKIAEAIPVVTDVMTIEEAKKTGAMALFGEKYGEKVRVVAMGDFSKEFCGGSHVANTANIRLFKIVSEAGVAAGVRRIEALTDKGVMKYYAELEKTIEEAAKAAKAEPAQLVKKIAAMNDEIKSLMSENEKLKAELANNALGDTAGDIKEVNGVKYIATKVDGVEMVFQLTPKTESTAEMNTYIPKYKALWTAVPFSGTMHNLYTLRGAEVRDGNAWAQYIMEAKELFGDKAEVVFQAHNWPHWGNDVIKDYMANTASVYKYIFSQTLMYINQGYTSTEIANMIELPDELNKVWYTRQYYGTLKHNVKAVYQKYMGWYDENPIHLDELEPTEYSKKLVEYLGDTDKVLEMAKKDFDKGEYQWVAQITNTLVYADPENKDARYLCADALEQLGYQAESGAWRNAYLTGAYELRNGTKNYPNSEGSGATALGMSTETMLDYLGICLDEKKLEDQNLVINLEVTDKNAKYLLRINHGVLIYSQEKWSDKADATIKTKSAGILGIAQNNQKLMDAGIEKVEGNSDIIKTLTSSVAEFPLYFNIIEP